MRELNLEEVHCVSGGGSDVDGHVWDLVVASSGLATALSRGNPLMASFTAGLAFVTAVNNAYGDQIHNAIWDVTH